MQRTGEAVEVHARAECVALGKVEHGSSTYRLGDGSVGVIAWQGDCHSSLQCLEDPMSRALT
jgi:hypothetical protein